MLSFLEIKLSVITATDANIDVVLAMENAGCGYSIISGNQMSMQTEIYKFCYDKEKYMLMKENACKLLITEFHVKDSYQLI